MAFVKTTAMSQQTRYWALLLASLCLPARAQPETVTALHWPPAPNFYSEVPVYQLPLQTGYNNFQITLRESRLIAGKKRQHVSDHDVEDEAPDQWLKHNILRQMTTKRRKQAGRLVIFANQVLHGRDWCRNCAAIIKNGYIESVQLATSVRFRSGDVVHAYPSATLSPGFVDVLIHGANGHDVMHGTVESLHGIARKLVEEGTTAFLPSSMTASREDMMRVAGVIRESMQRQSPEQAEILGWHAEGPYFAAEKIGCHNPDCRRNPDINEVSQWQRVSGYSLRVITVAPELPGALPFTRWASGNNIVVSIGHTMADCTGASAAIDHGATMATHLYNAMNNGSHQKAGCSTAIKTHPDSIYFTLIVDGLHIDPANILDLAARTDFASRAILITDGIMAKYKKDGTYTFGGRRIVVRGKEARLEGRGNLAGSILKMNEAVANLRAYAPNISLKDALLMASDNPARAIQAFGRGLVSEGYNADITLLDTEYNVLATYRGGNRVYQASAPDDFYEFTID